MLLGRERAFCVRTAIYRFSSILLDCTIVKIAVLRGADKVGAKQTTKMKTFKNRGIMGSLLVVSSDKGKTRKTAFREFPVSSPDESPMQHNREDTFSGLIDLLVRVQRQSTLCR